MAQRRGRMYKCTLCTKEFVNSSLLSDHVRTHTDEKPHMCSVCGKVFKWSKHLNRHMASHKDEKLHQCTVCKKTFTLPCSVQRHMRIHTGEKLHKCFVCIKDFTRPSDLKDHMRIHRGDRPYQCSVCSERFLHKGTFKCHMVTHTGESPYKCSVCSKGFTRRRDLRDHMRTHTGEKPYECPICHQEFSQTGNLKRHKMRAHNNKCTVCNKNFPLLSELHNHMTIHTGEKPHRCEECGRLYDTAKKLRYHILTHRRGKPHVCSTCNKKFGCRTNLVTHMMTHTGEKPHKCSTCGKSFSAIGNLNEHLKIHTLKCYVCNVKFPTSSDLENHKLSTHAEGKCHTKGKCHDEERSHNVEQSHKKKKAYKCSMCRNSFAQSSDLQSHMMTHVGEKPHKCSMCNRKFSYLTSLKEHTLTAHKGGIERKSHQCSVCSKRFTLPHHLRKHMMTHIQDLNTDVPPPLLQSISASEKAGSCTTNNDNTNTGTEMTNVEDSNGSVPHFEGYCQGPNSAECSGENTTLALYTSRLPHDNTDLNYDKILDVPHLCEGLLELTSTGKESPPGGPLEMGTSDPTIVVEPMTEGIFKQGRAVTMDHGKEQGMDIPYYPEMLKAGTNDLTCTGDNDFSHVMEQTCNRTTNASNLLDYRLSENSNLAYKSTKPCESSELQQFYHVSNSLVMGNGLKVEGSPITSQLIEAKKYIDVLTIKEEIVDMVEEYSSYVDRINYSSCETCVGGFFLPDALEEHLEEHLAEHILAHAE